MVRDSRLAQSQGFCELTHRCALSVRTEDDTEHLEPGRVSDRAQGAGEHLRSGARERWIIVPAEGVGANHGPIIRVYRSPPM